MAVEIGRRTTGEWEAVIGAEVRAARIAANLDQAELAKRADVSLGALKNLEAGRGSTLRTLIRVVRALGRAEWLVTLAPPITVSPLAMLSSRRSATHPRQRVSRPRAVRTSTP
ncbi:MAG: helix-turn-helix transcriptional regulator [Candidatus Dormibacteria bacterium]